ncbi:hypothetical protein A3D00_01820 [Candidatus Woesebacteria bacterium RIFCSPHIGHO2_02_FULL_38_9]|uniref:Uncharacterized protein n=1 Tax=Candidatus Woesebacteria bacterium RIFCSPHIGHO2_01_FULL_39_28 TaxID=1802496 RepID=A0A1F7YFJ1_9BACT|nr:MAG: hypothetical protein A2627_03635 [Candidatus Woesebacteria bacterium RIFCSPHIGHO2_01_FULL_39_28]OGM33665.1 MAG: hypothetical protein A3D00_01820 [Candidatus Woesebacteria bacterium RIFCSPHIGHO2_02_FULL_38_9]OGM58514.1 MAG: hypothetical protein A3A50_00645 [Candidatus Woesebacteria bacterium RIFCSPLOWO2_01_FULL_38_20]
MASTKYKEYFQKMLEENKELFDVFRPIHDNFALNTENWRSRFNQEGEKVVEVIHDYENRLCMHSEKSGYGQYSASLSEKFWNEVRKLLPLIDQVGIKIENSSQSTFSIKKINLETN